jgi:hypothetical protein
MRIPQVNVEAVAMYQTVVVPPPRLPPLFILTVPEPEIAEEDASIYDTLADVLESPGPPMTIERWRDILRRPALEWPELDEWWQEVWYFPPPWRPRGRYWDLFREELRELRSRLQVRAEPQEFARELLEGLLSGPDLPLQPRSLARGPFPWPYWLSPASLLAEAVYANRRRLELSEGEATTWTFLTGVLAAEKSVRVRATLESILDFDVPFALSRRSDKTPLSSIMSGAQEVVFLPVTHGALSATYQIHQGNYVVAFKVAAASGAITLILVATRSLAELLLRLGRRRRRARQ